MAHLAEDMAGQLRYVTVGVVGGVLKGDCNDLLVHFPLILHGDDADGIAPYQAQRRKHLAAQHQHVQRVAVVRKGARDQTVVCRIVGRGIKDAVQNDMAGLLIQLVLFL